MKDNNPKQIAKWERANRLAKIAAAIIFKGSGGEICADDFDDMVSEGTLEIMACRVESKPDEYYISVAKYAALHWLMFWRYGARRSKLRNSRTNQYQVPSWVSIDDLAERIIYLDASHELIESPYSIISIAEKILESKNRSGRAKDANTMRDALIVQLRAKGESFDYIGVETGTSARYVKNRIEQLKKYLSRVTKS